MISGKLKEDLGDMPFRLLVSAYRRRKMLSSMFSDVEERKNQDGYMKSVSKYLNPDKCMTPEDAPDWESSAGFKNFQKIIKSARRTSSVSSVLSQKNIKP